MWIFIFLVDLEEGVLCWSDVVGGKVEMEGLCFSLFVSSSWLVWRNVLARFASVFFFSPSGIGRKEWVLSRRML